MLVPEPGQFDFKLGEPGALGGEGLIHSESIPFFVTPAQAGVQGQTAQRLPWIPAFAQGCPGKLKHRRD